MPFLLRSPAFEPGEAIPKKFTADGENISPALEWTDAPPDAKSFALIVEDPDAPSGTFRHWGVYNIAANRHRLPEGFTPKADDDGALGTNDFGHRAYDGPKPPRGDDAHSYHFRIAALDTRRVDVSPRASADEIWRSIEPHILAQTELVGFYSR